MSFALSRQTVGTNESLLQKRAVKQKEYSPSSVLQGNSLPLQQESSGDATAPVLPAAPEENKTDNK